MYQQQAEDEVDERQRIQALAAYRSLQLRAGAPLEVISEVYWLLAARAKQIDRSRPSQRNEARVQELNHAYEVLTARDRFGKNVAGTPPNKTQEERRTGLFAKRPSSNSRSPSSHYDLLCVDLEAEPDVTALCAGILIQAAPPSSALREQIAEARRVLCDPELRAEYDAFVAGHPPPPSVASAARDKAPEELDDDFGILTAIAMDLRDVARLLWRRARAQRPEQAVAGAEQSDDVLIEERQRVPPVLAWNTAAPTGQGNLPTDHEQKPASAASTWFRSLVGRLEAPPPAAGTGVPAATPAPKPPARERGNERLMEAEHARLMTLRDEDETRPLPASVPTASAVLDVALGELAFIEGPRAGERIRLGSEPLSIGAGETADLKLPGDDEHIAQEHARIWRHRDQFVFRQIAGEPTLISGEPLDLPMVILEDGDEITIGIHHLRFTRLPEIARTVGTKL